MQPPTATLLDAPRSPVAGSQPWAGRPAEPVVTPAAPHLKFSAVLGTTSANSSIFMRPTSCRDSSRLSPLPHTPPQRSSRPLPPPPAPPLLLTQPPGQPRRRGMARRERLRHRGSLGPEKGNPRAGTVAARSSRRPPARRW